MTMKWDCCRYGCYVRTSLPDWRMLDGCFDRFTQLVMDIDGIAHQGKTNLIFEKKSSRADLLEPQVRVLNSLVDQGNSAIAFWCNDPLGRDISRMRVWNIPGYDRTRCIDASLGDLRKAVRTWWREVYVPNKI